MSKEPFTRYPARTVFVFCLGAVAVVAFTIIFLQPKEERERREKEARDQAIANNQKIAREQAVSADLCHREAICRQYAITRQECATAGNFDNCLIVKTGNDFVVARVQCSNDGTLKPESGAAPSRLECLFYDPAAALK